MASPPVESAQEVADLADKAVDAAKSYVFSKILPWVLGIGVIGLVLLSSSDDTKEETYRQER